MVADVSVLPWPLLSVRHENDRPVQRVENYNCGTSRISHMIRYFQVPTMNFWVPNNHSGQFTHPILVQISADACGLSFSRVPSIPSRRPGTPSSWCHYVSSRAIGCVDICKHRGKLHIISCTHCYSLCSCLCGHYAVTFAKSIEEHSGSPLRFSILSITAVFIVMSRLLSLSLPLSKPRSATWANLPFTWRSDARSSIKIRCTPPSRTNQFWFYITQCIERSNIFIRCGSYLYTHPWWLDLTWHVWAAKKKKNCPIQPVI